MPITKDSRYILELAEVNDYVNGVEVGSEIRTLRKTFDDSYLPKFVVETSKVIAKYPFIIDTEAGSITNVQAYLLNRMGRVA